MVSPGAHDPVGEDARGALQKLGLDPQEARGDVWPAARRLPREARSPGQGACRWRGLRGLGGGGAVKSANFAWFERSAGRRESRERYWQPLEL